MRKLSCGQYLVSIGSTYPLGRMSLNSLYINNIFDEREATRLVEMILNPEIDNIRYIWDRYDCNYTQYFRNTLWLRDQRLAIVRFSIGEWPRVKYFLLWFNQMLVQSGVLTGFYGQTWAHKANPHELLCIC